MDLGHGKLNRKPLFTKAIDYLLIFVDLDQRYGWQKPQEFWYPMIPDPNRAVMEDNKRLWGEFGKCFKTPSRIWSNDGIVCHPPTRIRPDYMHILNYQYNSYKLCL